MKIMSGTIGMESERRFSSSEKTSRYSAYGIGGEGVTSFDGNAPDFESVLQQNTGDEEKEHGRKCDLSDVLSGVTASADRFRTGRASPAELVVNDEFTDRLAYIRQQCIMFMLSMLFGWDRDDLKIYKLSSGEGMGFTVTKTEGMRYEYSEEQDVDFAAKGVVKTEDGRNINFGIGLSMSSSFRQYYEEYGVKQVSFTDPLVINLKGSGACEIADQKFRFDLDCDGKDEELSGLGANSGFLALDRNEDGEINDGSELFGTSSGDGFRDLARYDEDHNGWIDENDSVFERLRIWAADSSGEMNLYTLKEQDVGAICLRSADTEFNLRDGSMDVAARIRSTGLFLYESSGLAGTVQQVDMAG